MTFQWSLIQLSRKSQLGDSASVSRDSLLVAAYLTETLAKVEVRPDDLAVTAHLLSQTVSSLLLGRADARDSPGTRFHTPDEHTLAQ